VLYFTHDKPCYECKLRSAGIDEILASYWFPAGEIFVIPVRAMFLMQQNGGSKVCFSVLRTDVGGYAS
jgi:hypothetical protein